MGFPGQLDQFLASGVAGSQRAAVPTITVLLRGSLAPTFLYIELL